MFVGVFGVIRFRAHTCRHGMTHVTSVGCNLVRKQPRFMANSFRIAEGVDFSCRGGRDHLHLDGSRANPAQLCFDDACNAVHNGVEQQTVVDAVGLFVFENVDSMREAQRKEAVESAEQFHKIGQWIQACGDATGRELDFELLRAARADEIEY